MIPRTIAPFCLAGLITASPAMALPLNAFDYCPPVDGVFEVSDDAICGWNIAAPEDASSKTTFSSVDLLGRLKALSEVGTDIAVRTPRPVDPTSELLSALEEPGASVPSDPSWPPFADDGVDITDDVATPDFDDASLWSPDSPPQWS